MHPVRASDAVTMPLIQDVFLEPLAFKSEGAA
jgi:hypothetical protein